MQSQCQDCLSCKSSSIGFPTYRCIDCLADDLVCDSCCQGVIASNPCIAECQLQAMWHSRCSIWLGSTMLLLIIVDVSTNSPFTYSSYDVVGILLVIRHQLPAHLFDYWNFYTSSPFAPKSQFITSIELWRKPLSILVWMSQNLGSRCWCKWSCSGLIWRCWSEVVEHMSTAAWQVWCQESLQFSVPHIHAWASICLSGGRKLLLGFSKSKNALNVGVYNILQVFVCLDYMHGYKFLSEESNLIFLLTWSRFGDWLSILYLKSPIQCLHTQPHTWQRCKAFGFLIRVDVDMPSTLSHLDFVIL